MSFSELPILTNEGIDSAMEDTAIFLHEITWKERSQVLQDAVSLLLGLEQSMTVELFSEIVSSFRYSDDMMDRIRKAVSTKMHEISDAVMSQAPGVLSLPAPVVDYSFESPFSLFDSNTSAEFCLRRDRLLSGMCVDRFESKKDGTIEHDKELAVGILNKAFGEGSNLRYWMVAGFNWIAKARSFSLSWYYDNFGEEDCVFVAELDDRTTVVCRWANGKRVRVKDALSSLRESISGFDPSFFEEKVGDDGLTRIYSYEKDGSKSLVAVQRDILDMITDPEDEIDLRDKFEQSLSDYELSRMLIPPLHHLCRSILLPVS